ncbi:hypothetical protein [Conexibacter sp. CPCC 206217]|uniref:hypothetical protein n=1 Tax=Conexibacter sp. CPCC 206217 TaxID=3064574 RepID=UPI002727B86D|nr:hypothetical protein [Conexibacter sp. CPCC 206217]MDO8210483.1 hypothetical protein [Conexibacter sp. CPCC 206217]
MRITAPHAGLTRAGRRLLLASAVAAAAIGGTATAALAAPAVSVSPYSGLSLDRANTLTVRGTGFTADAVDQTTGLYVAVTATVSDTIYLDRPSTQYIAAVMPDGPTRLNADGTFATRVTANRRFTDEATSREIDCAVTQCVVRAWRAHNAPSDANVLATQAIRYTSPTPLAGAVVTVSPRAGLSPDATTTVSIQGAGFDPTAGNGGGFYVAYGPRLASYWLNQPYNQSKYIRSTPGTPADQLLNADGTFSTTLDALPVYERGGVTYDCRVIQCGVLTFASRGNANAVFDTATPVSFASAVVSPATELSRDAATTVAVSGRNYSTGTYASVTALVGGAVLTDAGSTKWIRAGGPTPADTLAADGSFASAVTVNPTFTDRSGVTVDCRVTQCAISTWREHTNPTPEALYTTTPIAFAAAVVPPVDPPRPPVTPIPPAPPVQPGVVAPRVTVPGKPQTPGRNRFATIGTVRAGSQAATLRAPKSIVVKIARTRYRIAVLVPSRVAKGGSARVRVRLTRAAVAALRGRSVKVAVKVKVTDAAGSKTVTAKATLRGARRSARRSSGRRG